MSATVWSKVLQFFPTLLKGNSGAAPSINWNSGSVQSITLNAATVTPTFVNPVGGCNLALVITQDGTGGRAVTWPAAVSWIGGTAPILLSGAGQTTLVYFYWDGTTYWGSLQSGASPASIIPWTAVAAGTALAASLQKPNLAADSSGAQSTITLPSAATMGSSDGYEFTIKATGNMVAPVIVTAGAGTTIELLNAPGTFGASTWLPIQGQGVVFKYDKKTTTFKLHATSAGTGAAGSSAYNPTWYTNTDIYWDPAAGVDSDTGAGGHPLRTMAEIVRRFGSATPLLPFGQSLTVHQLTAQTLNVDAFVFDPIVTGGANFAIIGTTPNVGAAFSPTTVTAAVKTAAGNALQLNGNLPAGLAVGDIVHNTGVAGSKNSYAKVQAIAGGNATMSQPVTAGSVTTISGTIAVIEDNTWANTDSYQAMRPILSNLRYAEPTGGDATNPGGAFGVAWYQGLDFTDASGTPGDSILGFHPKGCSLVCSLCTFDVEAQLNGVDGFTTAAIACSFSTFAGMQAGGAQGSNCFLSASTVAAGSFFSFNGNGCDAGGDTLIAGTLLVIGVGHLIDDAGILAGGKITVDTGSTLELDGPTALLWGPGTVNVIGSAALLAFTGSTWANVLKVATLQLDGIATGWSPPAEGTFTLNGVTQVDVAGVNGVNAFPANATIALSLRTVGATPGIVAPYFSAAQAQNAFHVKSGTALANDTFNWCALPASGVALSSANLDIFQALFNPRTGARYAFL